MKRVLPTGTVTFLFTDIEGSTGLLHALGGRYADVLAEHRRRLREVFAAHRGAEVDTQGDAFFVAFARAADAVAAAQAAQQALAGSPVRVRMGLHTGEPSFAPSVCAIVSATRAGSRSGAKGALVRRRVHASNCARSSSDNSMATATFGGITPGCPLPRI